MAGNKGKEKGVGSMAALAHANPDCRPEDRISGNEFCANLETMVAEFRAQCDFSEVRSQWIWVSRFRAFMREHPKGSP